MTITMAATSAYDENESYIFITSDQGETIQICDFIDIPMIDHSFEKREITGFTPKKKKGISPVIIQDGESGVAIIGDIDSGWIKTQYNCYMDDDNSEAVCSSC